MKSRFLSFLFFTFLVPGAFSLPLESIVYPAYAAQLRLNDEIILETQLRNPVLKLIPFDAELKQFITAVQNSVNPGIMVEALYLYKKPVIFHTSAGNWDAGQKTGIFNQITAISTLAGIQYFSASRNTMRTFYEVSGVIEGPSSRRLLPDPYFAQVPAAHTLFARQKDLTFGDNVYRYDYASSADIIYFTQENITALNYGILPAIGRGNLRSVIAVFDCGDSVLIYIASMARAASLPGMGDRISSSFSSRAAAVLSWLTGRLNSQIFTY